MKSKMYLALRKFCTKPVQEILPYSTVKVFRKKTSLPPDDIAVAPQETDKNLDKDVPVDSSSEYRENAVGIQMVSRNIYEQLFKNNAGKDKGPKDTRKCITELSRHGIKIGESPRLDDVILKLPPLKGANIEEHFYNIAREQCQAYKEPIESLLTDPPPMPTEWSLQSGMTRYDREGRSEPVDYPEEEALIFDVEVCMSEGSAPTLACAVGKDHWYSWVSPNLIEAVSTKHTENKRYSLHDFIPLGHENLKVVVGHNVSFDRARIQEQYLLQDNGTRFLDTMSLHVCVSGITSYQRAILKSNKEMDVEDLEWSAQSSLNSLAEVYKLYCGKQLEKEPRNIFVKGTLEDVKLNFQNLMSYCANDVVATHEVFRVIYPLFRERFPHPATLAGMLELGSAYLPINSNWNRYINEANLTYEDLDIEAKYQLSRRADESCHLLENESYTKDLWMWDQDWSIQQFKLNKTPAKSKKIKTAPIDENAEDTSEECKLAQKFEYLYDTSQLPVRRQLLPGYPAWYRKLCTKPDSDGWSPGASEIGTGMQVTPKLLSLCWEGFPLHYIREHGWGFLVPFRTTRPDGENGLIPIEELVKKCPVVEPETEATTEQSLDAMNSLWKDVEQNLSKKDYYRKAKKDKTSGKYTGTGVWCNVMLEGCCWFFKLPHKDGPSHRVGNPLAKDFLNKFSENVLTGEGSAAQRVIEIARMLSYWRNNRDRIMGQLAVWLPRDSLPAHIQQDDNEYGAILPQVVVCGTLTRRAMEPTWMTASNAQGERVGSELRSMIQAPRGYKIVGADVDSQELWIASVLGDAHATGMHGATPLGWMTLSGTKSAGTDMHSMTAKAVGISRDHAKVINYARIYGAGQNFAERLLKQFNPTISDGEARSKAMKMFALTKGKKIFRILKGYEDDYSKKNFSSYEALKLAAANGRPVPEMFAKPRWEGGTESAMFNRLEDIAGNECPVTPFLGCRLSRALEPKIGGNEERFLPTRINWVVQSGAVDFLHLMLVSMRWLMGSNVRFCLSFHDEVRYLVKEDLAYKAALAMHATNLLTRAFCSSRIGLYDLPQSVAFFSAVEVDTALRKESIMDCKTPSNSHGLEAGYGIPKGESLSIYDTIKKAGDCDMSQWEWHRLKK